QAAAALRAELRFFDAASLAAVPVPHPSPKAAEVLGVTEVGVAEAAALLSARQTGDAAVLLVPKSAAQGVTVAVAFTPAAAAPGDDLRAHTASPQTAPTSPTGETTP
ncbi:cobalamin biosynthesis protein, partial [Nitratidesulfovibrio oxamicus]|uniref:cobalamin biosynthesis protein n=1 Tax=Nitratidesulfovibrio oxamicus TaxID=32016 RepID=UPI001E374B85